jgi:hypothetical protein
MYPKKFAALQEQFGLNQANYGKDVVEEKSLNREVLVSVISDIEKSVAVGIDEANRLANNLGGDEPQGAETDGAALPSDIHSRLYRLRSAIAELNRQVNRANNVVCGA